MKYFQMELLSIMLIQEQEERSLIRIKFKSMPRVLLHFMMQMEKTRKQLLVRLDRLSGEEKKDNVVTFHSSIVDRYCGESLGVSVVPVFFFFFFVFFLIVLL